MKHRTVTVREGDKTGPIDWDSPEWEGSNMHPDAASDSREGMRIIADALERGAPIEATTDGGWPRVGWKRVVDIGMYDGWPHWKPYPSWLDERGEWHQWYTLTDVRDA